MHHAKSLISTLGAGNTFLNRPLTIAEAGKVEQLLLIDATNYLYSACVSIGDALQAIDRALFTWATVKLYYSSFYLLRSLLALSGYALVFDDSKPKTLKCKPGETPTALGGSAKGSHQAVITYFTRIFPQSPLLSQEIDNEKPYKWLMLRREEANYSSGRFGDPQCPPHFAAVARHGVRRSTADYISDSSYLYVFDPDHAIIALPIETLKHAVSHSNLDITANVDEVTQRFFRLLFADRSGPMRDVLALLKM